MALTDRQNLAVTLRIAQVPLSFPYKQAEGKPTPPDGSFVFTADASTDLLTTTAHGLLAGDRIRLTSAGTLPAGLSLATDYYVIAAGLTANAFKVSATSGGSAIDITGAGTGAHSWARYLTAGEQVEVAAFLAAMNSHGRLPPPAVWPQAISVIAAFAAYHNSPAYLTWWHDNEGSRDAQYRLRRSEIMIGNNDTVPPGATDDGVGSDPPVSPIPHGDPP